LISRLSGKQFHNLQKYEKYKFQVLFVVLAVLLTGCKKEEDVGELRRNLFVDKQAFTFDLLTIEERVNITNLTNLENTICLEFDTLYLKAAANYMQETGIFFRLQMNLN
jgi:hypothetical protein